MDLPAIISRNLKAIRLRIGLSQRRLADATGFKERFLSALENHPRHVTTETLQRLADGLNVTVAELVADKLREGELDALLPKKMAAGFDECIRSYASTDNALSDHGTTVRD